MENIISTVLRMKHAYKIHALFFNYHDMVGVDTSWLSKEAKIEAPKSWMPRFVQNICIKRSLKKMVRCRNIKMVICLDERACRMAESALKKMTVKLITWLHRSLDTYADVAVFARMDGHIAISDGIAEQLRKIGAKNIHVLKNCLPHSSSAHFCLSRDVNKSPSFVYVGRVEFEGQKMLRDLIGAFSALQDKATKLYIIGGGEIDKCRKFAEVLEIQDRIVFCGWQTDPWKYCAEHVENPVALCLTSSYEGFPLVLIEAISRGVFCISSNCKTGPAEIVNGKNGLLYEVGDLMQLRNCMEIALNRRAVSAEIIDSAKEYAPDLYEGKLNQILSTLMR